MSILEIIQAWENSALPKEISSLDNMLGVVRRELHAYRNIVIISESKIVRDFARVVIGFLSLLESDLNAEWKKKVNVRLRYKFPVVARPDHIAIDPNICP